MIIISTMRCFFFLFEAINFHDNPKSCPNNVVENPLDKPRENWKVGKINYIDTLLCREVEIETLRKTTKSI